MDKEQLLNPPYNDSDSEDLSLEELRTTIPKNKIDQDRLLFWRVVLDLLVLVGLGMLISLVIQRERNISKPECVQHHLPMGSDLSGFVPSDISSRPTIWISGPDAYTFSADVFDDLAEFNNTVASWKKLTNAFVVASPYDERGPQIPFESGNKKLFVISGLHHLHCLTAIMEDFGMLQAGYSRQQVEDAFGGTYFTWGEHIAHCFNKVRQALMCSADSAVEGHAIDNSQRITHTGVKHICNDFSALMDWASQPQRVLPKELTATN